ncbi:MAG TPA: glycosyltransferase family 2 protein [Acidobacteriota bacterium]|nr:glycosyltransferase family 2 protein [Acidobacteriota bacterium]
MSFVLLTCEQVSFVEQAVRSALEQRYDPMELIISDDCSMDGTWQVARRLAREYSGPHRIRLLRQGSRKGIVGKFNTAVAVAAGDLIVLAGGDDVSLPQRAQAIWHTWHSNGGSVHTFCSRYHTVDENGAPVTYSAQELVASPCDGGAWYFAPPRP